MKPGFDIETYKTRFLGGARQYLFFVVLVLPSSQTTLNKTVPGVPTGGGRGDIGFLNGVKEGIKSATQPIVSKYNAKSIGKKRSVTTGKNSIEIIPLSKVEELYQYLF